jgi:hypothetical protein
MTPNHLALIGIALAGSVGLLGAWASVMGPEHIKGWVGPALVLVALLFFIFAIAVFGHGMGWHRKLRRFWPVSRVDILDAATQAYDRTRHFSRLRPYLPTAPNDIVTWYCNWLAARISVYGIKSPSTVADEIPMEYFKKGLLSFFVEKETVIVRDRSHKNIYEKLYVMTDKLESAIKELEKLR